MKKERTPRQPKVWEALLALIVVIAVVVAAIRTKVGIQMGLAMGGCTAIVFALLMGNKWSDIQDTVKRVVGDSATTLLILLSVGMMVGIWIIGGTVPTLLYYGLKICSPNIIVPLRNHQPFHRHLLRFYCHHGLGLVWRRHQYGHLCPADGRCRLLRRLLRRQDVPPVRHHQCGRRYVRHAPV